MQMQIQSSTLLDFDVVSSKVNKWFEDLRGPFQMNLKDLQINQ